MKRKITKIILIAFIAILMITSESMVFATSNADAVRGFSGTDNPVGGDAVVKIVSAVLGIVRTAGAAVAIIMLMTIAAKYIIASAGDRADIKKYALNYVIGAIILFAATGILGIVQEFVTNSIK